MRDGDERGHLRLVQRRQVQYMQTVE